jgi:hypothetical protein
MQFGESLDRLPPYLFFDINRGIALCEPGHRHRTFAIGDPDMPTPDTS